MTENTETTQEMQEFKTVLENTLETLLPEDQIPVLKAIEELPVGQAPNPTPAEEVLDTRTPEQVEADFLKEAEAAAQQMAENRDPAEIAAMSFHMFYPQFKNMVLGLSNKELRRLVSALIGRGHTSEPETPRFNDARTGQAFQLGLNLLQAKFMMIQKLELNALEKAQAEQEAKELAAQAAVTEERGEAALGE